MMRGRAPEEEIRDMVPGCAQAGAGPRRSAPWHMYGALLEADAAAVPRLYPVCVCERERERGESEMRGGGRGIVDGGRSW